MRKMFAEPQGANNTQKKDRTIADTIASYDGTEITEVRVV